MTEAPTWYMPTPTGYLLVLRQGDDVMAKLGELAERERIPSASFTGIAFLHKVTFGYYDFAAKAFQPRSFEDVEMTGLTGSLAWQGGKPSVHAHGAVAGADFLAHAGHLLAMEVGTGSAEITVFRHDKVLQREIDPVIGANVLQLWPCAGGAE
ncbi:PPC domain-containing DNA-binding protein [Frateuria defendens]|uniref:PPC domain-containing DNA-binding protein n=1 Tax=Frateuria defendens TaxID=2219559 RepID=UPI00066FE503|nr:PPC domain-containing DNA-binding protein [Frateuria defendens]